jgi:beta-phosphoglucomutase-like phosphatase (HAD superfamily)
MFSELIPVHVHDGASHVGPYTHWTTDKHSGVKTYFSGGDAVIHVEPGRASMPYRFVITDFDGTVVQTEGPGKFFYERRNALMTEAGILATRQEMDALQDRVWRWEGDFSTSALHMVARIQAGKDRYGYPIGDSALVELKKIIDPHTLRMWVEKGNIGAYTDNELSSKAHEIIAWRLEQIGSEMLAADPQKVQTLAPFVPGAIDLLKKLPGSVPVAIASGSFRATTIHPILDAHARMGNPFLRDRVGDLIAGAEDVKYAKPDPLFYMCAQIAIINRMRASGRFPNGGIRVADILFLGDTVGGSGLDVAAKREHSVIIVNAGNIALPGPLAVVASDFNHLAELLKMSPNDNAPDSARHVLDRLSRTLTA